MSNVAAQAARRALPWAVALVVALALHLVYGSGPTLALVSFAGVGMLVAVTGAARTAVPQPAPGDAHVVLQDAGPNEVQVVKVIRDHLDVDAATARALLRGTPVDLGAGLAIQDAEAFRASLAGAGARAEVERR